MLQSCFVFGCMSVVGRRVEVSHKGVVVVDLRNLYLEIPPLGPLVFPGGWRYIRGAS